MPESSCSGVPLARKRYEDLRPSLRATTATDSVAPSLACGCLLAKTLLIPAQVPLPAAPSSTVITVGPKSTTAATTSAPAPRAGGGAFCTATANLRRDPGRQRGPLLVG